MNKESITKLLDLIETKPELALSLVRVKDDFKELLLQIQLELVTEDNRDTLGHTVYAVKEMYQIFDAVILRGEALIQEAQKKEQQKKENNK